MFSRNLEDLEFLFESAGQPVLINDIVRQAIITNPPLSDKEERLIHTLDNVLQGDIVAIDDEQYLCVTESIIKRHGKYKSKIRHCNFIIEVKNITRVPLLDENGNQVYNDYGEVVMVDVEGEPTIIPSIVDYKSFSIIAGAITVAENQIFVTVQDNEVNLDKLEVNNEFGLVDENWIVINVDKTSKGLLLLTCEKR